MRWRRKKTIKKFLVFAAVFMALSVVFITVNAWNIKTSTTATIKGDTAELKAAHIGIESVEVDALELGIPGEVQKLTITLKVDDKSNRNFVYCIELNGADNNGILEFMDESGDYKLGYVKFSGVDNGKIYGTWKSGSGTTIMLPGILEVDFYGECVVVDKKVNGSTGYDGNETKTKTLKFDLSAGSILTVTYCQATDQAVMDVFGISLDEIDVVDAGGVGE